MSDALRRKGNNSINDLVSLSRYPFLMHAPHASVYSHMAAYSYKDEKELHNEYAESSLEIP